ncbi:MAG: ribokinase [Verrucomicrobia bacterium]|nr:ribokinase [Verrucomicrobiota bacterium]
MADELDATRPRSQVVVLGSLHLDILVHAPDRPKKGETLPGSAWAYKAGGKGGNQAVAAVQFGTVASMIGRVGDDDFGRRLLSHLRGAGVDARHVRIDPGADSGMSVAIIDAEGDYGAVIVSGANLRLGEEDLREAADVVQNARVLVLQNEIPEATNLAAAEVARRHRVGVILNAAPARPLEPKLAANVDLLVVNAVEAEMICGVAVTSLGEAAEAAMRLSEQVANVVVTAGSSGLAVTERGKTPYVEAAHPVRLVDTHGAGDAFIGALAARRAGGAPLAEAVSFANAAAALFVSTPAGQKEFVTPDQVTRFLFGGS